MLFIPAPGGDRPRVLFSCYFNQKDYGIPAIIQPEQPDNLYIASGPDHNINPDNSVRKVNFFL